LLSASRALSAKRPLTSAAAVPDVGTILLPHVNMTHCTNPHFFHSPD
jgi:hypothetical protein